MVVVHLLSCVWLFVTPWTAACQASLSFTVSQSLLKFMYIESVMPSNHLILCLTLSSCLQSFPASGSFPKSRLSVSGGQSIGASAWASTLPVNIQGWFPLRLTGLISLLSKGNVVGVSFHSFACDYLVVPAPLLERPFSSSELSCHCCQKSVGCKCKGLFLDSQFCSIDLYVQLYASIIQFLLL